MREDSSSYVSDVDHLPAAGNWRKWEWEQEQKTGNGCFIRSPRSYKYIILNNVGQIEKNHA